MSEYMMPIPSRIYNAAVGGHVAGANQIIDDETGLTLDKIAGGALEEKTYTSGSNNGMGRVVLRKNLVNGVNTLVQTMINKSNTIYVIQYDFTLGANITVPTNCILEFDGGSISGAYTLTGNNTGIQAGLVKIFNIDVTLAGTWGVGEIYPEWFGAKGDGVTDDSLAINKALFFNNIKFQCKKYYITSYLTVNSDTRINGCGATILGNGTKGNFNVSLAQNLINCAFYVGNKQNVEIYNFTFDKLSRGIYTMLSENINIHDIIFLDMVQNNMLIDATSNIAITNIVLDNVIPVQAHNVWNFRNDGIHIQSKCSDVQIYDIRGQASDDFIAIDPAEATVGAYSADMTSSMKNIYISKVIAGSAENPTSKLMRIEARERHLENVKIRDVVCHTYWISAFIISNDGNEDTGTTEYPMGHITSIEVENIDITVHSIYAELTHLIALNTVGIESFVIRELHFTMKDVSYPYGTSLIDVKNVYTDDSMYLNKIELDGIYVNVSSNTGGARLLNKNNNTIINDLKVSHYRHIGGMLSWIIIWDYINGGIDNIHLYDVELDYESLNILQSTSVPIRYLKFVADSCSFKKCRFLYNPGFYADRLQFIVRNTELIDIKSNNIVTELTDANRVMLINFSNNVIFPLFSISYDAGLRGVNGLMKDGAITPYVGSTPSIFDTQIGDTYTNISDGKEYRYNGTEYVAV